MMVMFNFFKKKRGFVPVEEVTLKEEENKVMAIHEKHQQAERKQKRKAFDKKFEKFKSVGKKFTNFTSSGLGGFGAAQEDIFFGSSEPIRRRSSRKKKKQKMNRSQREDSLFGDLGTNRFF